MLNEVFAITTNTRIHWLYLVPSLVISLFYIQKLNLFSLKYFWNRSSKLDLKLFVTNRIFKFFCILPLEAAAVYQICKFILFSADLPNLGLNMSSGFALTVYTVSLFVFDDFLRFGQHLLMHKVPALWEIHKVHHSAHTLNPMSLYRVHFIEVAISACRRVLGTVTLTCIMFVISTQSVSGHQIAGALAFNFIFNIIGGNLRHSHIPLSFGFLERVFISPLQHQIHHSKNPSHFDKNFGVALSVWDQLCGSWHKGDCSKPIKVGLSYSERNHSLSLASSLIDPIKSAFNKTLKANSSTDLPKQRSPQEQFIEPPLVQPILQIKKGDLL